MKLTFKHAAVAGLMAVTSSSAFAAVTQAQVDTAQAAVTTFGTDGTTGTASTNGNGSLFFAAYDPANGTWSYVQNLGLDINTFSPANATGTVNFSIANLGDLTANASSLNWGVYTYDSLGTVSAGGAGSLRYAVTLDPLVTATTVNNGAVNATGGLLNTFVTNNATTAGSYTYTTTPGSPGDFASVGFQQFGGNSTVATAGGSLNMYQYSNGASALSSAQGTILAYVGTWTLNLTSGLLTYTAGSSPVPLPAGVWLLLSGLIGAAAVGRRKLSLQA